LQVFYKLTTPLFATHGFPDASLLKSIIKKLVNKDLLMKNISLVQWLKNMFFNLPNESFQLDEVHVKTITQAIGIRILYYVMFEFQVNEEISTELIAVLRVFLCMNVIQLEKRYRQENTVCQLPEASMEQLIVIMRYTVWFILNKEKKNEIISQSIFTKMEQSPCLFIVSCTSTLRSSFKKPKDCLSPLMSVENALLALGSQFGNDRRLLCVHFMAYMQCISTLVSQEAEKKLALVYRSEKNETCLEKKNSKEDLSKKLLSPKQFFTNLVNLFPLSSKSEELSLRKLNMLIEPFGPQYRHSSFTPLYAVLDHAYSQIYKNPFNDSSSDAYPMLKGQKRQRQVVVKKENETFA